MNSSPEASARDSSSVGSVRYETDRDPGSASLEATAYWRIGILAVLIVLLFRHEIYRLTYIWTKNGTWSHGWIVPLFSGYLLYTRRDQLLKTPVRTNWLGFLIMLGAMLMYAASIWPLKMGYPKTLAIVLLVLGVVLWLCGWKITRISLVPILYLLLALPLPDRLYVRATMPMRKLATKITTAGLNVTVPDIEAEPTGTTIVYLYHGETRKLNVAEACSGMRSLMGLTALGVALAFLGSRPNWQRILLILSCVPIAVFCNVIRVYITSMLQVHGYEEYARGSAHMMLGILTFMLAAGLFLLESYVLENLFIDEPEESPADPPPASAGA